MSTAIIRLRVPLGSLEPENTFHSGEAVSMFTVKSGSSVFTSTESVIDGIETYNGWSNRETWAAHLWLSNDEGLYNECRRIVLENPEPHRAEQIIKEYVSELLDDGDFDQDTQNAMKADIGSLWRVDWLEVAKAFAPDES